MNLQELRKLIDETDDELIRLFQQRMEISEEIAKYKYCNNIPIYDEAREQQKLQGISAKAGEDYVAELYALIFELSRRHQERVLELGET